jgi:hypothetical protein
MNAFNNAPAIAESAELRGGDKANGPATLIF